MNRWIIVWSSWGVYFTLGCAAFGRWAVVQPWWFLCLFKPQRPQEPEPPMTKDQDSFWQEGGISEFGVYGLVVSPCQERDCHLIKSGHPLSLHPPIYPSIHPINIYWHFIPGPELGHGHEHNRQGPWSYGNYCIPEKGTQWSWRSKQRPEQQGLDKNLGFYSTCKREILGSCK